MPDIPNENFTAEELLAIFAHYLFEGNKRLAEEKSRWKALRAKAELWGLKWADLQRAMEEWQKTDAGRQKEAETLSTIFSAIGIPAQLDMFEAVSPARGGTVEMAAQRGRLDCVMGDPEAPEHYIAGTPEGQAYIAAYRTMSSLIARFEEI